MLDLSKQTDKGSFDFTKGVALPFIFIIISMSLVHAQESISLDSQVVTAPFGQNYDLKRTCSNNGTYCSTSTVCNITLIKPDGSLLSNNRKTSNNFAYYNLSLNSTELLTLGRHSGSMTCTDPAGSIKGNGFASFYLDVTSDGKPYQKFPIEVGLIILGFALIVVGKAKEELSILQTIGGIFVMVMGVLTLFPGYSFLNYSTLSGLALGTSTLALGFWFLIERAFSHDTQVARYDQDDDGRYHD